MHPRDVEHPAVEHLAVEHAMRLVARDDLVVPLLGAGPGTLAARAGVGRLLSAAACGLPAGSPLAALVSGSGDVDPQWRTRVPSFDGSLASQLEFLSLCAPDEVISEPCPYLRLESAREWFVTSSCEAS